jgi:F-type H+-transporting ATPase subunit b
VRVPLAVLAALVPVAAVAAGGGHGAEHHAIPWAKLLFSTINLAIFLYILRRFAWPLIRSGLSARRDRIVAELEHAARAKREAEALAAEWKERLAGLAAEIAAMREKANIEIAAEREEILAAARRMAESIRRDAEKLAEQELLAARGALRAEVARQALAIASNLAAERLSADDQRRFVSEFIEQVGT